MSPRLNVAAVRLPLIMVLSAAMGCSRTKVQSSVREALVNPRVASVEVIPASTTLPVGQTLQLFAIARNAFGGTLTGRTVTWSSTPFATVSETGVVTGVTAGSATITATSEGRTGTAYLTVTSVPVALVTVAPTTAAVQIGQTVSLAATLRDAGGNTLSGRVVAWTSSSVAATVINGLVTGVAAGSATITATSEGQSGTAFMTVLAVSVASVTVTPATSVVQVGQTVQLTVTTKDAGGNVLSGRVVAWSSDNVPTATVTAGGLVMCLTVGTATITATSEGVSGTAAVSCTPAVDQIQVTYSTLAPGTQTWVLLDGQSSIQCEDDVFGRGLSGNPADFAVANTRPDAVCKAEVAVFASEHAAVLDLNPPFTTGADIVPENPGPAVPLEINLWVVAGATAAEAQSLVPEVKSLLQAVFLATQTLLDENHVGVELRLESAGGLWEAPSNWTFPTSRLIPTSDVRADTIGNECTQSGIDDLHLAPTLYDGGRLNIYVVDLVKSDPLYFEYSCRSEATPPTWTKGENIIYFSRLYHMSASLAHVLGHAFSLIDKGFPDRADGHTGSPPGGYPAPWPGFTADNIMWAGLPMDVDPPPSTFTLGQVYRMTLDDRSWLNTFGPRGKFCRDSHLGDIACPPLAFGW